MVYRRVDGGTGGGPNIRQGPRLYKWPARMVLVRVLRTYNWRGGSQADTSLTVTSKSDIVKKTFFCLAICSLLRATCKARHWKQGDFSAGLHAAASGG